LIHQHGAGIPAQLKSAAVHYPGAHFFSSKSPFIYILSDQTRYCNIFCGINIVVTNKFAIGKSVFCYLWRYRKLESFFKKPIITLPNFEKIDGNSARGKRRLRLSEAAKRGRVSQRPSILGSEGSNAKRDQCDRAALSFAASLLVLFLWANKENERSDLLNYIIFSFFYLPLCPVFKGAKEGARKGHPLSRPFGLSEVYNPLRGASRSYRDFEKLAEFMPP
jgi:hypothetical protein